MALTEQGKPDQAIAECRAAIRLKPDDALAHTHLGAILCDDKHDPAGAIVEFRAAIRLKPHDASAHANLGVALEAQGKHDEAIAELRMALQLKPGLAMAHSNLASALRSEGKHDEAIAEHRTALKIAPGDAREHNRLGVALDAQGKRAEAIAEYREAIRLDPRDAMAQSNLNHALMAQGKVDEALAELRAAPRLNPDDPAAHKHLGVALEARGQYDEAIAEYRAALRLNPTDSHAHYQLGNALMAQGRPSDSAAAYCAAIRLEPDFAEAHCNLARTLQLQGDYAASLEEFRRGHALGSKKANWRYPSAAWVRRAEQLVSLAGRLAAVLKGDDRPRDASEWLDLAQMCSRTERHAAASRFWAEALAADPALATNPGKDHLHEAARSAARAGTGQTADDPPASEAARIELRKQAHNWLRDDLELRSHELGTGTPAAGAAVRKVLGHWKRDPYLAGVRDRQALEALPENERVVWHKFWTEVESLDAKAGREAAQ